LLIYKLSYYLIMYREDWYNLLSLYYKLSKFFTIFIQSEYSDCSLCVDEMLTNLRFKKETIKMS